jgi:hypothetical protein
MLPQVIQVIQVVDYALQIATVAVINLCAVQRLIAQAGNAVVRGVAITEPVGDEQVNKIFGRNTLRKGGTPPGSPGFNHKVDGCG